MDMDEDGNMDTHSQDMFARTWTPYAQSCPKEDLLASTTAAVTMLAVLCIGLVRFATVRRLGSAAALAVISRLIRILQVAQARLGHPPPRRRTTQDATTEPEPAHKSASWIWLYVRQMRAARTLGYNELGWDEGVSPPQIANRFWHELTGVERAAARILDYTADLWNAELLQELSDAETGEV